MPAGGAITLGALGLGKAVVGLINSGKAKRQAAQLAASRPKYSESPYAKDSLALTESELSTGMSGEAKNAYEQGIDRSLSTSLNAVLKGGGSANNIAQVFDASTQGRQRLAMMKENLRLNQVNNVVRSQQMNTEEREKAFQFNEWAPWADASKANAGAREAADDQIWSGLQTAGSGVMKGFSAAAGKKAMNQFFTGPSDSSGGGGATPARSAVGGSFGGPTDPGSPAAAYPTLSSNIPPVNFDQMPSYNLPTMATQE